MPPSEIESNVYTIKIRTVKNYFYIVNVLLSYKIFEITLIK